MARRSPAVRDGPGGGRARFVTALRIALPLAIVGVLGGVLALPQLTHERGAATVETAQPPAENGVRRLGNARYTGTDSRARPYTVSAAAAAAPVTGNGAVDLDRPSADLALDDGSRVALSARSGWYFRDRQRLHLSGEVTLLHDEGYRFRTEAAVVDLDARAAFGDVPVAGQGPFGRLDAAGFQILEEGRRIVFTGKSRLVLRPGIDAAAP